MYLISIYFDEETNNKIKKLIVDVAQATGENFMIDNNVPPHITVMAIETKCENKIIDCLEKIAATTKIEKVKWVSIGTFLPQVIYIEPVLNEYLHRLISKLNREFLNVTDTIISQYYQPFNWLPHCTIGKQLTKEQMVEAYKVLQNKFTPFEGRITKIGIAKTNPHRDIKVWDLMKNLVDNKNTYRFFENKECEYFPCHKGIKEMNCMFCYCPFYSREKCPGSPGYIDVNGVITKDCSDCSFPHKSENYEVIVKELSNK